MATRHPTSIDFIVKPKEDLYLEGSLRTLPRVSKGEPYPCQMQKNQTFSCLFRHYAKHNGLKKEDLVFFFVDELLPDQMPETVHLMPQDEIWVEHRVQPCMEIGKIPEIVENTFSKQFKALLESGNHSDIVFLVGEEREEISAHRAILSARNLYFEAMFRPGGMSESSEGRIEMSRHDTASFKRMIEFIYTGGVNDLNTCTASEIISLLEMSNEYLLVSSAKPNLGVMCEEAASKVVNLENIGQLMLLCARYDSLLLRGVCKQFVVKHGKELRKDKSFRQEIEQSPELGLLILDAMQEGETANSSLAHSLKRRRITETASDTELALVPGQAVTNTIGAGLTSNEEL